MPTKKKAEKREPVIRKPAPSHDAALRPEDFAQALLLELNKGRQDPVAQLLGADGKAIEIRGVISTQCPTLDEAIGRGGYPLGRSVVLHGAEASGKTTLALHAIAEVQRRGGLAVYIDTEFKLDRDYARNIGVDIDNLVVVQPRHLEATFSYIAQIIDMSSSYQKKGEVLPILVVLDSIDATKSKAVVDGTWEDIHVGPEARVWSDKFPKLVPRLSKADVTLLLISQVRTRIGVIYGSKEKTAGGNAPRFYASLILEVKRAEFIKRGDELVGNETKVFIGKSSVAPPFKTAHFRIMYGTGIDYEDSLLRIALKKGVVEQSGSWYSFDGLRLGNGIDAASAALKEAPDLKAKLLEAVK